MQSAPPVTGLFARFAKVGYCAEDEHRRSDCPDHQAWLIGAGDWRLDTRSKSSLVTKGSVVRFEPFQRCHRISIQPSVGFSLQVPRGEATETVSLSTTLVWQTALLYGQNRLDALTLDELVLSGAQPSVPLGVSDWLAMVYEQIQDDPLSEFTLESLAHSVGISPSRLAHEFKAKFREPIFRMRNRLRIERLLSASPSGLKNPSEFGFYDASHLDRALKQHAGFSTRQLRQFCNSTILYKN